MDCAYQVLSVALAVDNETWYAEIDAGTRHSELIMECADLLFGLAGIRPADLNLVACMKGPGSFTGLRIAYSTAKGIAMALGIPLGAVPTLDCLAYPLSIWPGLVLPAIDAKGGCFFAALYRDGKRLSGPMDASPETLAKEIARASLRPDEMIVLTGPGAELLFPLLSAFILPGCIRVDPDSRRGRARELLKIAKSTKLETADGFDSGPVYLRKSDAEQNKA